MNTPQATENLKLIQWADSGFPPIDLSEQSKHVVALIKEVKHLRNMNHEHVKSIDKLEALNHALSTGLAVAAFKGRLKEKVNAEIVERIADRDEAAKNGDRHTRTVLNGEIIALKDTIKLIDETP